MGLIIDSFAGGGGASTGIERGTGRKVDVAINHDPLAVAMHRANHPDTIHYCQNVWRADPQDVVKAAGGGPVDWAWFSPDCKHFSKAKGGKPVEKGIRDLAWVVVLWAQRVRPKVIALENVEEFQTWGPLTLDNLPCPDRRGETFSIWVKQLRKLGYKVEWKQLRACDYGAPTIRKRLFLLARCDGQPIVWPEPTHGAPDSADVLAGRKLPWRSAASIIDWSIPCPSIFNRQRPLVDATCRRIAAGIMRYVINSPRPFIVPITHRGWGGDRVHDGDKPLHTITMSKGGEFALVVPYTVSVNHGDSGGRRDYPITDPCLTATQKLGTALVSAFMVQHNTGVVGHEMAAPLSTITARGTQQGLMTSHLVKLRNNCIGQDVETPVDTITTGGHFGEVRAFLVKYYGDLHNGQDLQGPLHTATTRDRFGLVTCQVDGETYAIADIGMRMLTPRELFSAQGFPADYIIDHGIDEDGERIALSKTTQIGRCGNSVCPDVAEALARANMPRAEIVQVAA